jgi:multidrug efflux pump
MLNDVRARVAELVQSFPGDMAWKVTYDPTASVTATLRKSKRR